MIIKLLMIIPPAINVAVFWFNRHRSNEELKNVFITFQLVLAVLSFFTGNIFGALGKLLFILLVKILSAGFVKTCWLISCVLDVFGIVGKLVS